MDKQYTITKSQRDRFTQALEILKSSRSTIWGEEPLLRACVVEAMKSMIEDLTEQMYQLEENPKGFDESTQD